MRASGCESVDCEEESCEEEGCEEERVARFVGDAGWEAEAPEAATEVGVCLPLRTTCGD